jgi:hypothetical protein
MLDPYAALAVGIVKQAVFDLANDDPVRRMDALLWFCDQNAADLFYLAGLEVDPLAWLRSGRVKLLKNFKIGVEVTPCLRQDF